MLVLIGSIFPFGIMEDRRVTVGMLGHTWPHACTKYSMKVAQSFCIAEAAKAVQE